MCVCVCVSFCVVVIESCFPILPEFHTRFIISLSSRALFLFIIIKKGKQKFNLNWINIEKKIVKIAKKKNEQKEKVLEKKFLCIKENSSISSENYFANISKKKKTTTTI